MRTLPLTRPSLLALALVCIAGSSRADEKPATPVFVAPKLVHFEPAAAPSSLAARGSVDVVLSIEIDDQGKPTKVAVKTSAGGDDAAAYDDAAVTAAKQFTFSPGTADGKPVSVAITYRYHFFIEPPPPPPPPPPEASPSAAPAGPVVPFGGRVRRAGDRAPLSGVSVTCDAIELEAITDDEGRFSFPALPVGKRVFKLRSGEIIPADVKLTLAEGKRLDVTWYALPKQRYTSTVHGKRIVQETVEYTLSADEVKHIAGTQGDVLKAVQNLPGVARAAFGGGQIAVWGSSPADTRTYVDGVQIPVLFHFGGLRSTISSEVVEDLRFLPGGYSADYGRGTGGVILIETSKPKSEGIHGFVQLNLIDGSAMVEGKITKNLSFSIGGRRSWIDAILPLFTTSSFQLSPVYYDYQGRLSWRATPRDDVDVLLFGSDDVVKLKLKQPDPSLSAQFDSHTYYHRALVKWTHRLPRGATLTVTPSLGYDVPIQLSANVGNIPLDISAHLLSYNLKAVARVPITKWLRLDGGLDFEGNRWVVTATAPASGPPAEGDPNQGGTASIANVNSTYYLHRVAPYLITDFSLLGGKIDISPQIRLEEYVWSNFQTNGYKHAHFLPEPRLQLRFELHKKVAIKFAVGVYNEAPDPFTLTPVFGNPAALPTTAVHYVAGIESKPWTGGFVQAQVFYKDLYNVIVPGAGALDPNYTNDGRGRVYGADFLVRQELWKGLFGWISYTVSRSERKDTPDDPWRVFSYDQTHILTLIASYKFKRGYQVGLRFRVVSGNPYTPVRAAYFVNNDGQYQPIYGTANSARLQTFNQLDVRFDKAWTFNRWKLSLYLDIQNLYNAKNPEGITYNYNFTQTAPITGLPFLPVFGIRGDF